MYCTQMVSFVSRQPNLIPFAAIDQWNDISTILCIFRPSNIHLKHLLFLSNVVAADVATRTLSLRRPVIHTSADTSWGSIWNKKVSEGVLKAYILVIRTTSDHANNKDLSSHPASRKRCHRNAIQHLAGGTWDLFNARKGLRSLYLRRRVQQLGKSRD